MKNLFKTTIYLIIVTLGLISCSDDDNSATNDMMNSDPMTIAEIVASSSDYTYLLDALEITGLTSVFTGTDQFTVFAPNNQAFEDFLAENGFSSLNQVPVSSLEMILLNHVVSGNNMSSSLTTGYLKTLATESSTSNPIDIYINTSSGVSLNGVSQVISADIMASNGVIHAVNSVIPLPTVVTFATADERFSNLVAALTRENDFEYVSTLSSFDTPAPFTVFAPTNEAFVDLLSELNVSSLSDIDAQTLASTLNTHVVASANVLSSVLSDGIEINTLGDSFTINIGSEVTFTDQNGREGSIIITDVQSANGVIHVVDRVILPNLNMSNTISDFVTNNEDYSLLAQALQITGLDQVLSGSDNFTVFAPNNNAFTVFLSDNGFSALEDVPVPVLEQVLLNHVLSGVNMSSSLSTGYVKTLSTEASTSNFIDMYINTSSGVLINGDSAVTQADITVDNGVIHAVDKVIGLPTVVTFATADSTFSTLVAALTREASFNYVSTLSTPNGSSPAPFTVFAPTNPAFADLLTELGVSSLDDIATATLEATLNTHVIAEANVLSTDLSDGMTVSTLGDTFVINLGNGVTFTDNNNRNGNIIVTDVQASNGVIHVVDKVILPQLN